MRLRPLFLSLALVALAAPASAEDAPEASLYERLGGPYAIATVVDALIETLLENETLNANPAIDAARESVPKAGIKFHLTAMMCQATGGPEVYTGRTMEASHAHLNITEAEWAAMLVDFKATLDSFEVPQDAQDELLAIVATTKDVIVTATE